MGNIFSMAAPPLDTDSNTALDIAMYIISYLLIIGVVLSIGICICIYIDHRQLTRLSAAVLDEERNLNAREREREEKVEEAPPLPPQYHPKPNGSIHLGPTILHLHKRETTPPQH